MLLRTIAIVLISLSIARADDKFPTLKVGANTFTNVLVIKVTATDIFFTHNGGVDNAKLKDLPPDVQKHFNYNAAKGQQAEKALMQSKEAYNRQAAREPQQHPPDMARYSESNVPEGLGIGEKFPNFAESDVDGSPVAVLAYRGHVTLIDFWATWCPPCRGEVPNVVATYQRFHPQGFDIIGVSLDQDKESLTSFTRSQNMPWQEYFDGRGWQNKVSTRYGINSIPMNYLLDRHGIIIAKNLRGGMLGAAVQKAIATQ